MNEATQEKITAALQALADKLGQTGAHLWQVLIRQQHIAAVEGIVWVIVLAGMAILTHRWAKKCWNSSEDCDTEAALLWIASALSILGALLILTSVASWIINPEFGALSDLMEMFRATR